MKPKYTPDGESFQIDNYNSASTFSNFFPALAGVTGKPMWVFYVNRGQAIASFGINNKDGAMLEFLPANKAYQATSTLGFRTFIKAAGKSGSVYEPFAIGTRSAHQTFIVRPYELEIRDRNPDLGLEVSVVYYGVPNESVPVLARRVTFKNISKKSLSLQVVDGLPRIVPWGMNDYLVKNMSRTIEAFAEVLNAMAQVPFFKLKIEPHDRPDIRWLDGGFFSFGLAGKSHLPVVVDPTRVFGEDTSLTHPIVFQEKNNFTVSDQLLSNIMPSSLFYGNVQIPPGDTKSWDCFYGHAESVHAANDMAQRARETDEYFESKRNEMRDIYSSLSSHFGLATGDETLNQYGRVTFMDNILRGGLPVALGGPNGPIAHVFSRKHGDMERDYNAFQISATYYSQGNGNFRDVNQNRRNDLFVNANIATTNVDMFFNLLQLDGYNPLVVDPTRFLLPKDILSRMELRLTEKCKSDYQTLISGPVLAGQIYEFIKNHAADSLNVNNHFRDIMAVAQSHQSVKHGEGYWTDHWTYNLDHLDQYLAVFPEKKTWLLHEKNDFTFYDSDHFVRARKDKYILTPDKKLRQYGAVVANNEKKALIASRPRDPHKVRIAYGTGEIYYTTLFTKLMALAAIKVGSLDPFGVGIEMDADKPGWCDALNGLPGLFGSSTHESFELLRLVRFLLNDAIPTCPNKTVDLPHDIILLISRVSAALESDTGKDFRPVWDQLATAREEFREKTFFGLSDKIRPYKVWDLKEFLTRAEAALVRAQKKALDPKTKIPTSYFYYEVDSTELEDGWRQFLVKLPWRQHRIVSFLEGAVHAMKVASPADSKKIYQAVKKSKLWDKPLGLYRLNVSLAEESSELGRIRVFSPGWLENESVFLHMHYKYLLEILRAGLIETFLEEAKDGLIPFRNPEIYGRSIYENSSFIVSSAFPDQSLHGRGVVARLSGATSEFLSMIYYLSFGSHPFRKHEASAVFHPEPRLPKEWFAGHNFSLKIFGVPVNYENPSRRNTFGKGGVKPVEFEWILDGRFHRHKGRHMTPEASAALREGRLESLKIFLG